MSWVDAQRPEAEGGVPHLAHMLREAAGLDSGIDDARGSASPTLYEHLVSRGVHQSMLSMADSLLAKTWAADLSVRVHVYTSLQAAVNCVPAAALCM